MSGLLPGAVIAGKNTLEYAQKRRNLGYFTMTHGILQKTHCCWSSCCIQHNSICWLWRDFDSSVTLSQDSFIREDRSLAETFLLIHSNTERCCALLKMFLKYCLLSFPACVLFASWSDPSACENKTDVTILFLCLLFACSCVGLAWMILFMRPGSCQQDSLADCKAPWNVKKLFLGLYRIKNWSSGGNKSCHYTEQHMLSGCVIRSCCFIVFSLIRQQPTL